MNRKAYSSDLTDAEWALLAPFIPPALPGGRPRSTDMREVLDAIFYLLRGGCAWRLLPHEFPPWGTVHYYYRRFRIEGVWRRIHDLLHAQVRRSVNKLPTPSVGIIDSQSGKTAEKGAIAATTRARRSLAASAT